ncbi:MAG: phosphoribosylformylglycinamidine synthase subunit PurS [Candidatus Nitrohelix vancouverensis]|uniref:Phosphoribosylformylglycinamidine synthase subunit PurS n=1 Tax=Candidatus Nitrohelix vancouverensis TaxID=2705534 RepID=A0A7T0C1E9_9BACT|nr:MAG: phosphoribosylformylglycinamidine synthase subunit PurS [Candidatus Nitrohelix vancouverensis]
MLAQIHVTLKNGVLDSQGKAVHHALSDLGFNEVKDVRVGKYMEVQLKDITEVEAEALVKEMCEKLLANTVIESYRFSLVPNS